MDGASEPGGSQDGEVQVTGLDHVGRLAVRAGVLADLSAIPLTECARHLVVDTQGVDEHESRYPRGMHGRDDFIGLLVDLTGQVGVDDILAHHGFIHCIWDLATRWQNKYINPRMNKCPLLI